MCEYCDGRKYLLNQNVTENLKLVVATHEKTLGIGVSGEDEDCYIDLLTNFCPMCGEGLKEGSQGE